MARLVLIGAFLLVACSFSHAEIEFTKATDLQQLMDDSDEQVVLGISTRANCGEPCELFNKFLNSLEQKMKGYFKVAQADITTSIHMGSDESTIQSLYNVTTIPMIQVFPYGIKSFRHPYTIITNTTSQLMHMYQHNQYQKQVNDVFLQFLPKGEVLELSSSDVEDFFAKEPEKGRVLLVTSKKSTPPMLTKLALDFGQGLKFGELRSFHSASMDKLKELGIKVGDKFPKLLIGRPGAKPNQLEPYTGELKLGAIHEHLTTITPGVIIPELTRYTDFESTCINKAGVCIVALLPSRFDKPLDIFKKVASRRFSAANGQSPASLPNINFAWVNSDRQEEFAEGFDVDQFPAVLALNSRKKLFSAMKGTFETAQIRGFITAVLQGKESLIKIEKIPKLHKNNPSVSAAKMDELMGRRSDL